MEWWRVLMYARSVPSKHDGIRLDVNVEHSALRVNDRESRDASFSKDIEDGDERSILRHSSNVLRGPDAQLLDRRAHQSGAKVWRERLRTYVHASQDTT